MTYADLIFKLYEQIVNLTKENEKLRQELEATKRKPTLTRQQLPKQPRGEAIAPYK